MTTTSLRRRGALWVATLAVAAGGSLAYVPAAQAAPAASTSQQVVAQEQGQRTAAQRKAAQKKAAQKKAAQKRAAQKKAKKKAAAQTAYNPTTPYKPLTGATINEPRNKAKRHIIMDRLIATIRSVPAGGLVRMSDWNIDSGYFVKNALAAHNRGVTVQILMSGGVADRQNPRTGAFAQLKKGLAGGNNSTRPTDKRSFIKGCVNSCRGFGGINHAKFLTVSQTGTKASARNIVMVSSANITLAAGVNQWNDAFTITNNAELYNYYQRMFGSMSIDKNVAQPAGYAPLRPKTLPWLKAAWFNPYRDRPDPVLQMLNGVRCVGAKNAGYKGRTYVRVAHTALSGDRGMAIARKIKSLRAAGCYTKVVYCLMDRKIRNLLTSSAGGGAVPTRQLVRDRDGDGFYDQYLHTKIITISGHWNGKANAHVVRTGSENLTAKSAVSDETGFDIDQVGFETGYSRWIDGIFNIASTKYIPKPPADARMAKDPWKYVVID